MRDLGLYFEGICYDTQIAPYQEVKLPGWVFRIKDGNIFLSSKAMISAFHMMYLWQKMRWLILFFSWSKPFLNCFSIALMTDKYTKSCVCLKTASSGRKVPD
jgi:hypothetical protein